MIPLNVLKKVLDAANLDSRPLLLALSGGTDSLCLFYSLLEYQKERPIAFHVAHVDHGWREVSAAEAETLKQLAHLHQIPFHLEKLDPSQTQGNLEEHCRNQRYAFFKKVYESNNCQALIVGHQRDDQAETVLKRVLEGSHWSHCSGLKIEGILYGMRVLRPFLTVEKSILSAWLEEKEWVPFHDETNTNEQFLRARMRQTILPWLDQTFGKKVSPSLNKLGKELGEIAEYFDHQINHLWDDIIVGPFGLMIDFRLVPQLAPLEMKYFIRKLCEQQKFYLSHPLVELSQELIVKGAANRCIEMGKHYLWIDRGRLFVPIFLKQAQPFLLEPIAIQEGVFSQGPWILEVKKIVDPEEKICYSSWKDAWQGNFWVTLPCDNYVLAPAKASASYQCKKSSITKWWNNHKVPSFFRDFVPVIWQNDAIYHEFLTGQCANQPLKSQERLKICLKYRTND